MSRGAMISQRSSAYWRLMRADRPIGTLLLLWPTLSALLIAGAGNPPLKILVIFLLGVWVMRSAGCVINDYADRHIDGQVSRTKQRPLARGEVQSWEALLLFAGLLLVALLLVLQLNKTTIYLSFAAVAIATLYPFCKRFTQLPQVVLGLAFSFGILMAFTALEQGLPLPAWLLFFANVSWTVAYDTQYAMADRDDDRQIGVKSTAILFAQYDRLAIAALQLITLVLLAGLGAVINAAYPYYLGLVVIVGLFAWQHRLIWQRQPSACFQAFLHNNHVGWVLTLAIVIEFWFFR
ncbi:MAG: 4-hydroxybenzoate octaprenyltransferase [Pseudidiomarina mangrovi]|nr:MAG: 4-hydroxybenzoate octaprenyltransferase [Pseudidiomarina mangrovi]